MKERSDIFKKNLEIWRKYCPDGAKVVEELKCNTTSLIWHPRGLHNLKKEGAPSYNLMQDDIEQGTKQWIEKTVNLNQHKIYLIFGLDLGYIFRMAQDLLKKVPDLFLVYLEDDPEVIHRFLELDGVDQFLTHPQCRLYYISDNNDEAVLNHLAVMSVFKNPLFTAIDSYRTHKQQKLSELQAKFSYFLNYKNTIVAEYGKFGSQFIYNFFKNMLLLPKSLQTQPLKDQYKGIPAIICGAGPSLEKNIEVLKTLKEKALIFAGGTAMNALNAYGLEPHFGMGVDPNPPQYSRLIANTAFEVPYFYRNRMFHNAFNIIHGNRIYIPGTGGHNISKWFEEHLGIEPFEINEGYNVVNLSVSIAQLMGCNPILLVGVDLAYTNNQSYSPGILQHALHDRKSDFYTKTGSEDLLCKEDINGKPVYTLWKWVTEALWYGNFARKHPEIQLINCTEGGIGFPEIPNATLQETALKHLTKQFDFASSIHVDLLNSTLPPTVNIERIDELYSVLEKSLNRCVQLCENIKISLNNLEIDLLANSKLTFDKFPENIQTIIDELEKEESYIALLSALRENYIGFLFEKNYEMQFNPLFENSNKRSIYEVEFYIQAYNFLKNAAYVNYQLLYGTLAEFKEEQELIPKQSLSPEVKRLMEQLELNRKEAVTKEIYSFEDNLLTIIDPEFQLSFKESCLPKREIISYPNGKTKSESFFLNNVLHGPSIFYSQEENILAKAWYIYGQQQGKAWFYYKNGNLASLQRFKNGRWHGKQEYYYQNGNLKSLINYNDGMLNGDVFLFYENGKMARELHYVNNKRHGTEKLWNEAGLQIIEVSYDQDRPSGTARQWHSNGNILVEVIYDENFNVASRRFWDEHGQPWQEKEIVREDYFDSVTKKTSLLTDSLEKISENISSALPEIRKKFGNDPKLEENFAKIHKEIEHLKSLNSKMMFESGLDPTNPMEPIWKTPSSKKGMELKLAEITKKMSEDVNAMQNALNFALGLLAEQPDLKDKKEEEERKDSND